MLKTIKFEEYEKAFADGYSVFVLDPPSDYYGPDPRLIHISALAPENDIIGKNFKKEYIRQIVCSPSARAELNNIYLFSINGGNAALTSYNTDPEKDHAAIIAGLLQAIGIPFEGEDYSASYLIYAIEKNKYSRTSV